MIRHQFGQVEFASEHWFRLAATTLAAAHARGRPRDPGQASGPRPPRRPRRHHDRLASLILVLREGTVKQKLINSRRGPDQHDAAAAASRAQRPVGGPHRARRSSGARPVRPGRSGHRPRPHGRRADRRASMREFDSARDRGALQRRPAQRHGGAGVRPEREAPAGLLGAREPGLPGRAHRRGRRRGPCPGVHRRRERAGRDARGVARPGARTAGPAAPSASSASSGRRGWRIPTPSAPSASCRGLMNELVGPPLCLTAANAETSDRHDPQTTRAEERIDEIDISPTKLARARSSSCSGERDEPTAKAAEYLAALQRERAEFQNYRRRTARGARARRWPRRRGSAPQGGRRSRTTSTGRSTPGPTSSPTTHGPRASPRSTASCARSSRARACARSSAVGQPFDPREHEAIAQRPRHGPPRRRDRRASSSAATASRDRVLRPAMVAVAAGADDGTAARPGPERPN